MAREKVEFREKLFMIIEAIFIFIFLILTFVELYSVFMMYLTYISSQSLYYFYVVHNRLQMKYFNAYIKARNPKDGCPYHPPPDDNSNTRITYMPRQILAIGTIKKALPVEVTKNTQVYDSFSSPVIQNNTQSKKRYFEVDFQTPGLQLFN